MKVAFITNKPYDACETFVKLQIDNLPFSLTHLYGFDHPLKLDNANSKVRNNFFNTFLHKLSKQPTPEDVSYQLLKKGEFDVVIAQYGTVGILLTDLCKRLKLPLVVHFHGYDAVRNSVIAKNSLAYKKMFSQASFIFSVSHVMTAKLIALGCPAEKIVYNPCGPHPSFFSVVPTYSKKQIIAIGRFVEKKSPDLLIIAFSKVLQIHPDTLLIFGGDGPLLNTCKQLAHELNISEHVVFLGIISPKVYQQYLSESQVFAQHSITASDGDMEGTPVAILEASAAGLPIVSTLHAGIPDVIINGQTGYLVAEKDIESMANKIITLLSDKSLITTMGAEGKRRIHENFSSQRYLGALTQTLTLAAQKH
jgi:glycosyltransferase involved in cell wall biosynthesis